MIKSSTAYLTMGSLVLCLAACKAKASDPAPAAAAANLQTDEQKTLYALGLVLGRNVKVFNLTPEELELVKKGISDSVTGTKPAVDLDTFGPKLNELAQTRQGAAAAAEKTKGQAYAEQAGKEAGATVLPTGIVMKTITPGTGASPKDSDTVKVHYEGKLIDGTVFDSSVQRGQPAEFPLTGVIPCWTQGVAKMKVGEKARLVCPSDVAYRDQGSPPTIPGGATLVFEVELLGISAAPAAGQMPPPPGHPGGPPTGQPGK
jgi:FKBP-type peptidyl-prolyl cis-trans isomerase FkpA